MNVKIIKQQSMHILNRLSVFYDHKDKNYCYQLSYKITAQALKECKLRYFNFFICLRGWRKIQKNFISLLCPELITARMLSNRLTFTKFCFPRDTEIAGRPNMFLKISTYKITEIIDVFVINNSAVNLLVSLFVILQSFCIFLDIKIFTKVI